jgi:hypothetical protein
VEILTEKVPFDGRDMFEIALEIRDKSATPAIPKECPDYLADICKRCWNPAPDSRPLMREVAAELVTHLPDDEDESE